MYLVIPLLLLAVLSGSLACSAQSQADQSSQSPYRGPLRGERDALPHFLFSYESDWRDQQINNIVRNMHPNDRLHVAWPAAWIFRGETPLQPAQLDQSSFSAPAIDYDDGAQLRYGWAWLPLSAPVYKPQAVEAALGFPAVLRSTLRLAAEDPQEPPLILDVTSTYVNGNIVYSFAQNRQFEIGIALPWEFMEHFSAADWVFVHENAIQGIEGAELLLDRERWGDQQMPDFDQFPLLRMPALESAVMVSGVPPDAIETGFSFVLVAENGTWISTGVLSLHLPTHER
jgi:hypothetical protein